MRPNTTRARNLDDPPPQREAVDFGGAVVDAEGADVAENPFNGRVAGQAEAAEDLQ